jgi:AcrR family transcriptional regulator/DNA-binding MarR family transcriptional regulator
MIRAMLDVVFEEGYSNASVTSILSRARVSSKTFYTVFEGCEDCFLAAFEDCLGEITAVVVPAYQREGRWADRVRAALETLLVFLEEHRTIANLVFVEAPKAGAAVQERRGRVLEILRVIADAGRSQGKPGSTPPDLTNAIVVEGAIATIQARLSHPEPTSLMELANPLMSVIAYSYLGSRAAARELEQQPIELVAETNGREAVMTRSGLLAALPMRITYRTLSVLSVISLNPGARNRDVAEVAGITDAGQISKLLSKLERLGLIHNDGEQNSWSPNGWRLTARGVEVEEAIRQELKVAALTPEPMASAR